MEVVGKVGGGGKELGWVGKKQYGAWSGLAEDLLLLIIGCLGLVDQLALSRVCRSWRSVAVTAIQSQRRPLWQIMKSRGTYYNFVDSSTGRTCRMDFPELRACIFLAARHGWALVTGPSANISSGSGLVEGDAFRPIFFHPFSRTMIDLPYLYCPPGFSKAGLFFDFTAPPTSPECVVCAVGSRSGWPWWTSTCKRGEVEWSSRRHDGLECRTIWIERGTMVFSDGHFVCADLSTRKVGIVLAFDPHTNGFKCLSRRYPGSADHPRPEELVLCRGLDPDVGADMLNAFDFAGVMRERQGRRSEVVVEGLINTFLRYDPRTTMLAPFHYPRATLAPFWSEAEEGGDVDQFIVVAKRWALGGCTDADANANANGVWIRPCFAQAAGQGGYYWVQHSLLDELYDPPKVTTTPPKVVRPWTVRLYHCIMPCLSCFFGCLHKVGCLDKATDTSYRTSCDQSGEYSLIEWIQGVAGNKLRSPRRC